MVPQSTEYLATSGHFLSKYKMKGIQIDSIFSLQVKVNFPYLQVSHASCSRDMCARPLLQNLKNHM